MRVEVSVEGAVGELLLAAMTHLARPDRPGTVLSAPDLPTAVALVESLLAQGCAQVDFVALT